MMPGFNRPERISPSPSFSKHMPLPTLKSGAGISIVPVAVEHAEALASLVQQNVEHFCQYLPALSGLSSIGETSKHLLGAVEAASSGAIFEWHIFVDGTLCGAIRLKDINETDRKAKIGYLIAHKFSGRGIVTSAVHAVLAHCFGALKLNSIELRCAAGNEASKRVAERLGFVLERILRQEEFLNGVFVDHHVYGLLSSEFKMATQR
jgi:ribosomal-protein-serine acetyltransferase